MVQGVVTYTKVTFAGKTTTARAAHISLLSPKSQQGRRILKFESDVTKPLLKVIDILFSMVLKNLKLNREIFTGVLW